MTARPSRPPAPFGSVAWALVGVAGFAALYVAAVASGWTLEPDRCIAAGGCFCEGGPVPAPGLVRQPANTWSNLVPIAVGLAMLVRADRDHWQRRPVANPMREGGLYQLGFAGLVILLGLGSFAFHGSLTRLGGWLDTLSMILFITFVLGYDLARIGGWSDRRFIGTYALANVALGLFTWQVQGSGTPVFSILVAATVLLECLIVARAPGGVQREPVPWFALALSAFALALLVWRLSWTGGLLCDPFSLFQGHAVWHALAEGLTPWLLLLYLQTESRTRSADLTLLR